ncbi:hypothetical protein D3C80_2111100 [compost metagenome]
MTADPRHCSIEAQCSSLHGYRCGERNIGPFTTLPSKERFDAPLNRVEIAPILVVTETAKAAFRGMVTDVRSDGDACTFDPNM